MPDFLKNRDGRYITDGLSSKDFTRLFDLIRKEQTRKRRQAHRTLTPQAEEQIRRRYSQVGEEERRHVLYARRSERLRKATE